MWNVHEPQPGVYDFSGQTNLSHFLKLAQDSGLLVILRAGPYICGNWDYVSLHDVHFLLSISVACIKLWNSFVLNLKWKSCRTVVVPAMMDFHFSVLEKSWKINVGKEGATCVGGSCGYQQ